MKNYLYIFLVVILGVTACKKEKYVDQNALLLEQYGKDTLIIKKFLADNNIAAKKDSTIDIYYQIIDPGAGDDINWNANTIVTTKYVGKLLNGTVFDSTKDDNTYSEYIGKLIVGWQLGIPKIKKGGKIRLIIPSGFAYGSRSAGQIPPNSILDFDITLIDVK